jgi:sugar lactone lactonase YvrE
MAAVIASRPGPENRGSGLALSLHNRSAAMTKCGMVRDAVLSVAGLASLTMAACGGPAPAECGGAGTICTWAGTGVAAFDGDGKALRESALYWPMDMEFAPDGRPYVLDWQNHRVRRADGVFQTVIGGELPGDGPLAGPTDTTAEGALGTDVLLNHPTDIQFLPDGTLVLAAWHNHKIRTYDPTTNRVHVLCGAGAGDNADHVPAARALINQPKSVAVFMSGDKPSIYVADSRNQRIRVITADEIIDSVAGNGRQAYAGDDGPPGQASFSMQQVNENPEPGGSITVDGQGRVYLADTYNNRIRRIDLAAGMVTTVAGNGTAGFSGDGGDALAASLNQPRDLEFAPDGRLFIADTDNHRIRAVDLGTNVITTVAGSGAKGFTGDGGSAREATLFRPFGIAFDGAGNLYISDTFNNRIRKVVTP